MRKQPLKKEAKNMNQQLNTPDLYQVYKNFFTIGAAVNSKTLESEKELLKKHYNSLTAENEMKFELLQPEQGNFNFANADKLVAFANENNMKLRGHTLVWHNQTTEWLFQNPDGTQVNREILLQRMEEHISTVLGRYKGQFYSWDVVNEAISDDDSEYLRKSKWLDIIGEDFIAKAFEFAHQADPNASLFYND